MSPHVPRASYFTTSGDAFLCQKAVAETTLSVLLCTEHDCVCYIYLSAARDGSSLFVAPIKERCHIRWISHC